MCPGDHTVALDGNFSEVLQLGHILVHTWHMALALVNSGYFFDTKTSVSYALTDLLHSTPSQVDTHYCTFEAYCA